MTGRAVQILQTQNNNVTQFDNEALEAVFLREDVRDKRVVVVSISGIFGKGKSFLLNYMLKYLNSQCDPLWLNNKTAPLEGFSWGGRSKRETTGLLMWSNPFLIPLPSGEQVAVVLVDTQGTFDIETIVQECATVFSLSLLVSSVQVFNLSRNITEHDLQHLLLFTEYARQALGEDVERPFQKLQLLVRDWATPHLALFGPEGGKQLFNHLMQETNQQTEEAHWMRQRIRDSFAEISCFLMPHPGKKVTIEENYDGKVADMRPQFKDQLVRLVPLLLSPESLQSAVKVIQGHTVTAEQLCKLFQDYTNFFSNNNVPIVKPTSVAAADVRNVKMVAALAEIQFRFLSIMFRGAEGCYIDPDYVSNINDTLKVAILKMFYDERCVGGPELAHKHLVKLEQTMDLQNESLLGSNLELEEMTEAVYGNIVANLKVNLHSMSSDANEATSNLEGIGIALARYDVQNKLQARIESIDPAVRHIIYVGHRLADDESKFHDVIEILCEALEKDSNTAMQQAIAKIEGIGIALAILSSDVLARQDKAQTPRLSQEELDNLYSRVEKRAVRAARVQSRYDTASVLEIASTLTPREKRVLKVKKTLSLVFPFM